MEKEVLAEKNPLYGRATGILKLRETAIYNAVLEAVALGTTKLNDICQKTQIEKTKLSVYLKNLMYLRKYKNSPVTVADFRHLQQKYQPKNPDGKVFYWMFSKSGFTEELIQLAKEHQVRLVCAEELVEEEGAESC